MKTFLLCIVASFLLQVSLFGQHLSVRDNFNRTNTLDLVGSQPTAGKWKRVTNPPDTSATYQITSNAIQTYDQTSNNVGYIVWDSVVTTGCQVFFTVADRGTNTNGNPHVFAIYIVDSKDKNVWNGYRLAMYEAGSGYTDNLYIEKVIAGTVSNSNSLLTLSPSSPYATGDSVGFAHLTNNVLRAYYFHANGTRDSASVTDATYALTSAYIALSGKYVPGSPSFDNFMLGATSTVTPAVDTVKPTGTLTIVGIDTSQTFKFTLQANDVCLGAWCPPLAQMVLKLDGATVRTKNTVLNSDSVIYTIKYSGSAIGVHTAQFVLTDSAGNVYTSPIQNYNVFAKSAMWVDGYYANYNDGFMNPSDIDWQYLTDLILFSFNPVPSTIPYFSGVIPGNSDSSQNGELDQLVSLGHAHGVKILICLGGVYGQGATDMATLCADSNHVKIYASAIKGFLQRHGADGVDLDWEFPGSQASWDNLVRILRDTLNSMNPPGLMSAAVYMNRMSVYDVATTSKIDHINLMGYDQGTSQYSGYNAPLKPAALSYSGGTYTAWTYSTPSSVGLQAWINAGFSPGNLGQGMPMYGWDYTNVDGPCQPSPSGNGYWYYSKHGNGIFNVMATYPNGYHWDDSSKVPYWSYAIGSTKHFLTYDDSTSMGYKVQFGKHLGIGGFMLYEIGNQFNNPAFNGSKNPLMKAVATALGGVTIVSPPNPPTLLTPTNAATGVSPGSITFVWHKATGGTGSNYTYYFDIATDTNFANIIRLQTPSTDTTLFLASQQGITFNQKLFWRVRVNDGSNFSQYSTTFSFTTQTQTVVTPSTPVLVSPADAVTGQPVNVVLVWHQELLDTSKNSYATFNLQVSTDPAFGTAVISTPVNDSTYTTFTLTQGTKYYWRVQAVNGTLTSSYSTARSFTILTVVPPPPVASTPHYLVTWNGKQNSNYDYDYFTTHASNQTNIPTPATGSINIARDGSGYKDANGQWHAVTSGGGTTVDTSKLLKTDFSNAGTPPVSIPGYGTVTLGSVSNPFAAINTNSFTLVDPSNGSNSALLPITGGLGKPIYYGKADTANHQTKDSLVYFYDLRKNTISSVNGLTGAVTLSAGSNVTLTPSGNTISIASSGGGGSMSGKAIQDSLNTRRDTIKTWWAVKDSSFSLLSGSTEELRITPGAGGGAASITLMNGTVLQIVDNGTGRAIYMKDGLISAYDGNYTQGEGVVSIVDTVQRTAITAAIDTTNFDSSRVNGVYEVTGYIVTSTAGTTAGTATPHVKWNDGTSAQQFDGSTIDLTTLGSKYSFGPVVIDNRAATLGANSYIKYWVSLDGATTGYQYRMRINCKKISR